MSAQSWQGPSCAETQRERKQTYTPHACIPHTGTPYTSHTRTPHIPYTCLHTSHTHTTHTPHTPTHTPHPYTHTHIHTHPHIPHTHTHPTHTPHTTHTNISTHTPTHTLDMFPSRSQAWQRVSGESGGHKEAEHGMAGLWGQAGLCRCLTEHSAVPRLSRSPPLCNCTKHSAPQRGPAGNTGRSIMALGIHRAAARAAPGGGDGGAEYRPPSEGPSVLLPTWVAEIFRESQE